MHRIMGRTTFWLGLLRCTYPWPSTKVWSHIMTLEDLRGWGILYILLSPKWLHWIDIFLLFPFSLTLFNWLIENRWLDMAWGRERSSHSRSVTRAQITVQQCRDSRWVLIPCGSVTDDTNREAWRSHISPLTVLEVKVWSQLQLAQIKGSNRLFSLWKHWRNNSFPCLLKHLEATRIPWLKHPSNPISVSGTHLSSVKFIIFPLIIRTLCGS